jgi:hypothetical protein
MFNDPTSLLMQDKSGERETYFWVDGDALRLFLMCDISLDKKLETSDPIVCPESVLCCHGSLHPSTAIKGKLLRKPVYDAYVSLLTEERNLLSRRGLQTEQNSVIGREVQASENLICMSCKESRQGILKQQVELIKNMSNIYDAIQIKDNFSKKEDPSYYVIPKTWATDFKKLFLEVIKSVADFDKGGVIDRDKLERDIVFGGVDRVNLKPLTGVSTAAECALMKKGKGTAETVLDPKVNTKITCKSRNCFLILFRTKDPLA